MNYDDEPEPNEYDGSIRSTDPPPERPDDLYGPDDPRLTRK